MLFALMLQFVITIINALFGWIPPVTSLPTINGFSMDGAMTTFSGTLHGILAAMPPFQIVFYCVMFYYAVLVFLLAWDFVRWIVNLVRGSGS